MRLKPLIDALIEIDDITRPEGADVEILVPDSGTPLSVAAVRFERRWGHIVVLLIASESDAP